MYEYSSVQLYMFYDFCLLNYKSKSVVLMSKNLDQSWVMVKSKDVQGPNSFTFTDLSRTEFLVMFFYLHLINN